MAPTNNAPDLSTIAPGDRVAIRRNYGTRWDRRYAWTTATVQRVTAARITAGGRTYRRSDGMRLGDGGRYDADYLFPYDYPDAVEGRYRAALDSARYAVAHACGDAHDAARNGESAAVIRDHLDAARDALTRLEQLQAQVPTPEHPHPTTPAS